MKKRLFLLMGLLLLITGCFGDLFGPSKSTDTNSSKDTTPKYGIVEGTVSYYYNDYIGYKADVQAFVSLYKGNVKPNSLVEANLKKTKSGIYPYGTKNCDVNGKFKFANVPAGNYTIWIASSGRYLFSYKYITVVGGQTLTLTKNFYYLNEFSDDPEPW